MKHSFLSVLMLFGSLTCLFGCGSSGPNLLTVEGRVTVNGKPLESGTINLHSDDPKASAGSGMISSGTYLTSATAGKYKVTIAPNTDESTKIDEKYLHPSKTPLSIDVVAAPSPGAYDLILKK